MKKSVLSGSSKQFYEIDAQRFLMTFKDDIHGNNRSDHILGTGLFRKEFTYYFFRYLEKKGIKTHLDDSAALQDEGVIVKQCQPIKLEIIVRKHARGHWVDAHKVPLFEGRTIFDQPIIEFCLKMKTRLENGTLIDDPRINGALTIALHKHAKDPAIRHHLLQNELEVHQVESLALDIYTHYHTFLQKHEWLLEDFKFEIGLIKSANATRQFVVIDEISPDCSRIRDPHGNSLTKDLFRQQRPAEEILKQYSRLAQAIKKEVE